MVVVSNGRWVGCVEGVGELGERAGVTGHNLKYILNVI